MHKIGVIGLGFVGLTYSAAFASKGYTVYGIDIDENKIKLLEEKKPPFHEKDLDKYLDKTIGKTFYVSTDYSLLHDTDLIFICVGTPTRRDTYEQDLSQLERVLEKLGTILGKDNGFKTIVIKSTVLPGTTRWASEKIHELTGLIHGRDYGFVFNPEFLREGRALEDIFNPSRIVLGCREPGDKACSVVESFWRTFYGEGNIELKIMGYEEAELVKYASNFFLAMRIGFANTIANICEVTGNCDVLKVLEATGLDPRIGRKYLRPGLGYGGSCLPKDVKALIKYSRDKGYEPLLVEAVDRVNEEQPYRVINYLLEVYGSLEEKNIGVLGLAFKPGTSDVRESVSIKIIEKLLEMKAIVKVHDPLALENGRKILGDNVIYCSDYRNVLRDSDAVIIATDWDEYKNISPQEYRKYMKNPVVIDGRRIYSDPNELIKHGIKYYGIGYSRSPRSL